MPRKPTSKSLTARLDRLVSLKVRERAGNLCEVCGVREANQVHHVVGRLNRRVRFDERNLVAICPGCHWWQKNNNLAFLLWFAKHRPGDNAYLSDPENLKPIKRLRGDYEDLLAELEAA